MDMSLRLQTIRRDWSNIGERHGPFSLVNGIEARMQETWKQSFDQVMEEIQIEKTNCGTKLRAPTAEHAAAFLKLFQVNSGRFHESSLDRSMPGLLLFRGMRDARWKIVSSLSRCEPNNQNCLEKQSETFARLMREIGHHMIQVELSKRCYQSVSQHYGFPTNLIDFTPDPEVAVFFATSPDSSREAVVYFTTTQSLVDKGLAILLPPPMFDRIRLQRGVFYREPRGTAPGRILANHVPFRNGSNNLP